MARLALALDASSEEQLLADMVEHGHTIVARLAGWRDVLHSLDALAPEVIVVGAGPATLSAELVAECDARGIRVVAVAVAAADRAHARQQGLYEVFDAAAGWAAMDGVVVGGVSIPAHGPGRAAARPASLIAVWGPNGAPGRTTLAVNIAAELAAAGRIVALVDADPYGGAVAPSLGLLDEAPGFASACRLAGGDALDRVELERIAQRYGSPKGSFDVFTGLIGPGRWPELAEERVTAALTAIRGWAEYVVVDTGFSLERDEELSSDRFAPRRNAATHAAIQAADRVVAVGLGDPVGLARLLRGHAELLEHVEPERVDIVVNRVRSSVLGVDAHGQVRQTLRRFAGIEEATLLPSDGGAVDAALLSARTLRDAAPRSALRASIRSYAEASLLPRTAATRRGRPGPRLRRRVAAG